jgi:hypothetical protein
MIVIIVLNPSINDHNALTSLCDLDFGSRNLDYVRNKPHNGELLCQVTMKYPDECRSSAPYKHISMNYNCDLNFLPRDLVYARDTASHSGEHFYKVSLKSHYA